MSDAEAMVAGRLRARVSLKVAGQRWRLARMRLRCERAALARVGRKRTRPRGRILSYHSTGTPEWGVNDVSPAAFRRQVEAALRLGYSFVPAAAIGSNGGRPTDLAITFDDGLRSITAVTPFLRERAIPFTLFVVPGWIDRRSGEGLFLGWDELEGLLSAGGAEIGSHSLGHRNFSTLTASERMEELVAPRETIRARLGVEADSFAIPWGRARDWDAGCTTLAQEAGYRLVFAQSEDQRPAGTVGRSFVTRFDDLVVMRGILEGRFDRWEEWY